MNDQDQPFVSGMFSQIIDRAQGKLPAIQQYFADNPDKTDLEYYMDAQRYGISPLEIAMATGNDLQTILQRFTDAEQAYNALNTPELRGVDPRSEAFEQVVKDTIQNKAIQGLLLTNPYTAPVAPFVPIAKPLVRMFEPGIRTIKSWF